MASDYPPLNKAKPLSGDVTAQKTYPTKEKTKTEAGVFEESGTAELEIRTRITKSLRPNFANPLSWGQIFSVLETSGVPVSEEGRITAILNSLPYQTPEEGRISERLRTYSKNVQEKIIEIQEVIDSGHDEIHRYHDQEMELRASLVILEREKSSLEETNAGQRHTLDEKEEIIASLLTIRASNELRILTLEDKIRDKDRIITTMNQQKLQLEKQLSKHTATAVARVTDEAFDEAVRQETSDRASTE